MFATTLNRSPDPATRVARREPPVYSVGVASPCIGALPPGAEISGGARGGWEDAVVIACSSSRLARSSSRVCAWNTENRWAGYQYALVGGN